MPKPPVVWEAGDDDLVLTGQGGLGVVGQLLAVTPLRTRLNASLVPETEHPDVSHRDVVFAYIARTVKSGGGLFSPIHFGKIVTNGWGLSSSLLGGFLVP